MLGLLTLTALLLKGKIPFIFTVVIDSVTEVILIRISLFCDYSVSLFSRSLVSCKLIHSSCNLYFYLV